MSTIVDVRRLKVNPSQTQPYMFRVTSSPILRSTFDCIYSFWYNAQSVGVLYQKQYILSKVLLRMGEFVARNM